MFRSSGAPRSVSRTLVLSVAVPMVLFFAITIWVLDRVYRDFAARSLAQRLDGQLIALITAVDVGDGGQIGVRLLDPESRWSTPASGFYAQVRTAAGATLWSSPSLAGTGLQLPEAVEAGVAVLSRRLLWELSPGNSQPVLFSVAESTDTQQRELWRFRQQLVGWFVILTMLLLAVVGWLLRRALAPMRRLESEIKDVESGSREQLSASYPREIDGVARALNALLHSERQRIRRYRETLGNLAHGLKTPLAVMRTALQRDANPGPQLDSQLERMATIVDHQLRKAASSAGATLGQSLVAVAPIVEPLRAALLKVHAGRSIHIELRVQPDAGFAGDADDLTELLGNLLDNACKYGRGIVRLAARIDNGRSAPLQLLIEVSDNGAGIEPPDAERVLARGVRSDESTPGHGLGLDIVRESARLYGGALAIERDAELGGARVLLSLPGRQLPAGAC